MSVYESALGGGSMTPLGFFLFFLLYLVVAGGCCHELSSGTAKKTK